jgi:hypothetical protein
MNETSPSSSALQDHRPEDAPGAHLDLNPYRKALHGIVHRSKQWNVSVAHLRGLAEDGLVTPLPAPAPGDPKAWRDEPDPALRYYKFLASNVDWNEWPGGAAEIASALATALERLTAANAKLVQRESALGEIAAMVDDPRIPDQFRIARGIALRGLGRKQA